MNDDEALILTEGPTRTAAEVSETRSVAPRSRAAADLTGEHIDHFEVLETIGEGGMGRVHLALDTKLGRKVALKLIHREALGSAQAVEGFLFEARTTARFNHPHIVTVYAVGEHDGSPYVALEHVPGETLKEVLRARALPLREVVRIALAVAEALKEAHAHGVLHRDLKPSNVILPPDGRARVVDFGLAKRLAGEGPPSTRAWAERDYTWAGAGTPAYMAPEQWRGDETSPATDVWAFGALVFQLCAGRRPFDEPTMGEQEREVCSDHPAPRLRDFAEVPAALDDLVARCLAKSPASRPNAQELVDALVALDRPATPSGSRVWLAVVGVAALAAMGAGWLGSRDTRRAVASLGPRITLIPVAASKEEPRLEATAATSTASAATTEAPEARARVVAPKPAGARRPPFDENAAQAELRFLQRRVAACAHSPGARAFNLSITFDPKTGGALRVSDDHRSAVERGQSGACVKAIAYSVSVPPFAGEPVTRSVGLALAER
ncbi:MAG: serine/threonine-protein kinase [Polyangiaceae bacterium]